MICQTRAKRDADSFAKVPKFLTDYIYLAHLPRCQPFMTDKIYFANFVRSKTTFNCDILVNRIYLSFYNVFFLSMPSADAREYCNY